MRRLSDSQDSSRSLRLKTQLAVLKCRLKQTRGRDPPPSSLDEHAVLVSSIRPQIHA